MSLPNAYLILLAPFIHTVSSEQPWQLVQAAHDMYPDQFTPNRLPELALDLKHLFEKENLSEGLSTWLPDSRLTFILGLQDAVFTKKHHHQFLNQFKADQVSVHELDDDHSFSKAPAKLTEIILPLLK